ncbi:MAG: glycosyltransferase family 4 protein [Acidobacteriales bacterium]|nr:glycosyltransferase family 4 protein [Terriglobales bacterium]
MARSRRDGQLNPVIKLFLNGIAASAGGGLTYLRNVAPHLSARGDVQTTLALSSGRRAEFENLPRTSLLEFKPTRSAAGRFWLEQTRLPAAIRRSGADVLISAGNFALRRSPVPQILLSGNSLYTSADFYRDLRSRREYRMWFGTRIRGILARRSLHWAKSTVAPSAAFADQLRRWSGVDVLSIHHGFDHEQFHDSSTPLSESIQTKLEGADDAFRVLFVSHYSYYRSFETLISALPFLKAAAGGRKFRLVLTCNLNSNDHGGYRPEKARALIRKLGVSEEVVELGTLPYRALSHLYRSCHLYATPAYTETFAHPLVEAMSSGLPIVASDLPVHREICRDAALYFPRFSPQDLAARVLEIASSPGAATDLRTRGIARSRAFSWKNHVQQILELAATLMESRRAVQH